jgi:aspartyl-tRNA synthetase
MLANRKLSSDLNAGLDGQSATVAGWVQDVRNLGGIAFVQLRDSAGVVQVTLLKKKLGPEMFKEMSGVMRESVVSYTGVLKANKEAKAGVELLPESWTLISPAEAPLPLGVIDKVSVDLDTRLNSRFMDLRKDEVRAVFRVRSELLAGLREHFASKGFVEVHTPKIVAAGAEGGATLFPIAYFDKKAYLAQSPQLYKQSLMSTGLDRIYEVAPAFRAEASDTVRHLSEFTSLDVEMAFIDSSEDVMSFLEGLVAAGTGRVIDRCAKDLEILGIKLEEPTLPFPRIPHKKCVEMLRAAGHPVPDNDDIDTTGERVLGELVMKEHNHRFFFITDFPTELKRTTFYAMRKQDDSNLTGYFDLEYDGEELVSGGQREHRLDVLLAQMAENGMDPAAFEFYLKAFRFGMPPHGGFGLGIERFVHKLLGLPNIRECVLFPRDRLRLVP